MSLSATAGRLLQRGSLALLTVLGAITAAFFALRLVPVDPAFVIAGAGGDAVAITPEVLAAIRAEYHLDRPLPVQFLLYLGRLLQGDPAEPGMARIGRMAVERVVRGTHLGRDILETLADAARQRGDREVQLHAQCSAQGFYKRLGFAVRGAPFDEAGIPHVTMVRAL